jgi:hypothetical protein
MGIYVESRIRASLDALWLHTQQPEVHERWDLRFSSITYLPKAVESDPQRFRYCTRIGFGLKISGEGESIGTRDLADGSRTSSLRFSSSSPLSLIREGSGYWKYIPTEDGIRFLTWYDYRTRWGIFGRLIDRLAFRPLMGWATAWSFDRLRRWLEHGEQPQSQMTLALVHAVARLALAFILAYHGLVPKLFGPHVDELVMLQSGGISAGMAHSLVPVLGAAEVTLAIALLLTWRKRHVVVVCLLLMPIATLGVALAAPQYLGAAFNPVTLNLGVAALAMVDLLAGRALPTATRCSRTPPGNPS